jgi:hypothetical protein
MISLSRLSRNCSLWEMERQTQLSGQRVEDDFFRCVDLIIDVLDADNSGMLHLSHILCFDSRIKHKKCAVICISYQIAIFVGSLMLMRRHTKRIKMASRFQTFPRCSASVTDSFQDSTNQRMGQPRAFWFCSTAYIVADFFDLFCSILIPRSDLFAGYLNFSDKSLPQMVVSLQSEAWLLVSDHH